MQDTAARCKHIPLAGPRREGRSQPTSLVVFRAPAIVGMIILDTNEEAAKVGTFRVCLLARKRILLEDITDSFGVVSW